jgi:8-hydroxy-5-deazaflavin:NADPH oxidoreductase
MKVGILGSGTVGQTLANGFAKHGYEVTLGTNTKSKHDELRKKLDAKVAIATFEQTARFGDIIVLAVKGTAAESALTLAGIPNLIGKTIIDTTNPIAEKPPVNGVLPFFTPLDDSLMERLQRLVPGADFVKAFSCIGSALMVNPDFGGVKPSMFIAGNDDGAKAAVRKILVQFGFETEDMGKAEAARAIEPLCILWCIPGFLSNSWTHAFKLLRK